MATTSYNLTTYYAKRIIGDTAAANASSALLQTGDNISTSTWILHRDNRTALYGIKYLYDTTTTDGLNNGHDKIEFYGGRTSSNIDVPSAWIQLDTGNACFLGKAGIGAQPDVSYQLYVNGSTFFTSIETSLLSVINNNSNSAYIVYIENQSSNNWAQKIDIGTYNYGLYIQGTGTSLLKVGTNSNFYVNSDYVGTNLPFKITSTDTTTNTSNTVTIETVASATEITNSTATNQTFPFIFSHQIQANNGFVVANHSTYSLDITGLHFNGTGTNSIYNGPNNAANGYNGSLNNLVFDSEYGISFTSSNSAASTLQGKNAFSINCRTGDAYAGRMFNAVWNDYAEFRECDDLEPGRCVQEQDNGHLIISNKRLISGASIITDTYGFAEGQTSTATTPIAVCGRVLAYPYRNRKKYHAGMAVCSAPNGTIDIMSRREIKKYPDAIIGVVSEIPEYESWGSGKVKINNRIWIKIK